MALFPARRSPFPLFRPRQKKEAQGVYVGSLDSKETKFLLNNNLLALYAPTSLSGAGYLLFVRDKNLMAQQFDPERLRLTGDPAVVAEGVMSFPDEGGPTGYSAFSASASGHLTYLPGTPAVTEMGWFDRAGKSLGVVGSPGQYSELWQSPDGKRVTFGRADVKGLADIWLLDLARGQ